MDKLAAVKFEEWYSRINSVKDGDLDRCGNDYKKHKVNMEWLTWRAAWNEAVESAKAE